MSDIEDCSTHEEIFGRLVDSGQRNRDSEAEKFAQDFVAGGEWLARQRDPFKLFQSMITAAVVVDARKRKDAQEQFERVFDPTVGHEGAVMAFDLLVGLSMFKADPGQFYRALLESMLAKLESQSKLKTREQFKPKAEEWYKPKEEKSFEKIVNFDAISPKEYKSIINSFDWPENKKYIIETFPVNKKKEVKDDFLRRIIDFKKDESIIKRIDGKKGKPRLPFFGFHFDDPNEDRSTDQP